jgi:hypothetical protein
MITLASASEVDAVDVAIVLVERTAAEQRLLLGCEAGTERDRVAIRASEGVWNRLPPPSLKAPRFAPPGIAQGSGVLGTCVPQSLRSTLSARNVPTTALMQL